MNKKLLFGLMSFAAMTACTNDDFESQKAIAEQEGSVQFEVINDAITRASMNGSKIAWSAEDGDLFTLYHGGATSTGYLNATYKAEASDGATATLTTPTMIKAGTAVMVWPVDTLFTNDGSAALAISVSDKQTADIENNIPYVSDVVTINALPTPTTATYNEAGYNRKYPIYMRPMASQLTLKADYAGTDAALKALEAGEDGIDPIKVTSVELSASTEQFTTKIPLTFTAKIADDGKRWDAAEPNNNWTHITGFDRDNATQVATLSTKCLSGNESAKFLILPQKKDISSADATSQVVVNTTYGKVIIAGTGTGYSTDQLKDAWYRFIKPATAAESYESKAEAAETSGENAGKHKTTTTVAEGFMQTLNGFSKFVSTSDAVVKTEPVGTAATRYVKVLLDKLTIDGLHVTTDKQLYDVVRVWKEIGNGDVTVKLDGDAKTKEFAMSQKTIAKINEINAALAKEETPRSFSVQPCTETGEACETIVFTGGGEIAQNLTFIKANGTTKADIALNAGETWKWNSTGKVIVDETETGVKSFINRGTLVSDATATLAIYNNADPSVQVTIPFENAKGAEWNVTAGDLNVQFDVTNYGTVNITNGAEYIQDKAGSTATTFTNEAQTLPGHFLEDANDEVIGVVNNSGVFATVNGGKINNYGLIEHAHKNAKTYISANQTTSADFGTAADHTTAGNKGNKIGRINLPLDNATEDNISINSVSTAGFVSITATGSGTLKLSTVSSRVNYLIVKGSYTAFDGSVGTIEYVELNQPGTEIEWGSNATLKGLMVMSNINIKQTSNITINKAAFLHKNAKMYVGGKCTNDKWSGYYGDTEDNFKTNYRTY